MNIFLESIIMSKDIKEHVLKREEVTKFLSDFLLFSAHVCIFYHSNRIDVFLSSVNVCVCVYTHVFARAYM